MQTTVLNVEEKDNYKLNMFNTLKPYICELLLKIEKNNISTFYNYCIFAFFENGVDMKLN